MPEIKLDKAKIEEHEREYVTLYLGKRPRKDTAVDKAGSRRMDAVTRARLHMLAVHRATLDAYEELPIFDPNEWNKTFRLFEQLAKQLGLAGKIDDDDDDDSPLPRPE